MEKIVEQTLLYDFYGEMLNAHQKAVYEDAVFNDLSLAEIAEEQGISRQGVHDMIKRCNKMLADYENKLHLVERFLHAKELAEELRELIPRSESACNAEVLERIRQISEAMTELF